MGISITFGVDISSINILCDMLSHIQLNLGFWHVILFVCLAFCMLIRNSLLVKIKFLVIPYINFGTK